MKKHKKNLETLNFVCEKIFIFVYLFIHVSRMLPRLPVGVEPVTCEIQGDPLCLRVSCTGQRLNEEMDDWGPRVREVPLLAGVGEGRRYTPGVVQYTLALQVSHLHNIVWFYKKKLKNFNYIQIYILVTVSYDA